MSEEQFLNVVSQMLFNAGYTKTRDTLLEEAKLHGFVIAKKEIPLSKSLEIHEPDVIRRAKRNEVYWHQSAVLLEMLQKKGASERDINTVWNILSNYADPVGIESFHKKEG